MATDNGLLNYAPTSSASYRSLATSNVDSIIERALTNYSVSSNQADAYKPGSNENLAQDSTYLNSYVSTSSGGSHCKFLPPLPLDQYKLNNDPNPEIIRKRYADKIRYKQELAFRFLEPPQPPKPGDIVVKQLPNRQIAPAPPLVVRQVPPKPANPAPLVIREAPPNPPARIGEKLVLVPGKVLAPPTRKVVVERLPAIPPKPQQIYLEKWLPFKQQKRRVVFQKADPDCIIPNPRNLVIQWENPEVEVSREYKNLGTHLADPEEYIRRFGTELLRHEEFKSRASRIGAPDSIFISDSHRELGLPELEGEIEALKLVDLERSGLSQYREYLGRLGVSYDSSIFSSSSSPYGLITSADSANLISIEEATHIMNNFNASTEKIITESELRNYFNSIDSNHDGVISYEEFKSAVL